MWLFVDRDVIISGNAWGRVGEGEVVMVVHELYMLHGFGVS